jgi:hypothetical protein
MLQHARFCIWHRIVAVALLVGCLPASAPAVDALKESTALKFVPADAEFFVAGLRQREQYDIFVNSKAFAKLSSMPMVQWGMFMAKAQWENPQNPQIAGIKQAMQQPENQQLVELLKDAVSSEVFMYGEPGFGAAIGVMNQLNAASNAGQFEALAAGEASEAGKYQLQKVIEVLEQQGDQLKFPNSVIGFRLTNSDAAVAQLARLEAIANAVLGQQPQLQQRFSREDLGGASYLTLKLDGSLVPWQQIPFDQAGVEPEQMEKLVGILQKLQLTISVGVRDNYLLLALGEDNQHLADLGTGDLLADSEEMAVIEPHASEPLVGISYGSQALAQAMGSVNQQMDQLVGMAKQLLPMAPISPDLQEELIGDLEKLGSYVQSNVPEPGTTLVYSFMTDAGYESYLNNWGENKTLDPSQELTILNHMGGSPIAFYAARGKTSAEDYDLLAKVFERIAYYVEQIALQQADDEQQAAYEQLKTRLLPLVERLGQVTREKLIPAFEDGQGAVVLDVKSTSSSWHAAMPPAADGELPMLELGLVYGVSDAGMVKDAAKDYFSILQEALDTLHEASTGDLKDAFPDEVPQIKLAAPQQKSVSSGTIYYYTFPAESGLDAQIAMNAGLSNDTAVLSLLPRFTKRLLDPSPLEGTGPLADASRPLAAAGQLKFANLIEGIEPWIDYGVQLAMDMGGAAEAGASWVAQMRDVLEVVKCFKGISTVTYQQDDRMVTHVEWTFEDL